MREKKNGFIFLAAVMGFVLLSVPQPFHAEESSARENRLNREFLVQFGSDFKSVCLSPVGWKGRDWLGFAAVSGTGLFLYVFDGDIQDWNLKRRSDFSKSVSKNSSTLGDGGVLLGLMTLLYASGELLERDGLRKTALLSLESWLTSGVLVLGLKVLTGRARPQSGQPPDAFHPFSWRANQTSFPSGHASSAWAVAATIADQSDSSFIDVLAYSLASLVAVSRVHDRKHWASDVFIGSAIGYVVAKKICALNRNPDGRSAGFYFEFSGRTQAVTLSFVF